MIHPRVSSDKIRKIIEVLEELPRMSKKVDDRGLIVTVFSGEGCGSGYGRIIEKLETGLSEKEYNLTMEESRDIVIALDLYNRRRTDNVNFAWDPEVEKIFHELKKRYAEIYGESIYQWEE
ncbi:MAG: hypothetical protein R6U43_06245 [Candidatus Krumholzibacteriales bacterium]